MADSNSTSWQRVVNTTTTKYIREVEEAIKRRRKLFAMLKKRGRILYKQSGDGCDWKVRYRRGTATVNDGEQTLEFSRVNRHKSAFLDWKGYAITDSITKREKLTGQGTEGIVKTFGKMLPTLRDDMDDFLSEELYIDSSATGNSGRFSGIESIFVVNGTLNIGDGTQRAANVADVVGSPNDTYATLTTDLSNYGGSWDAQSEINTTWPFGRGKAQYDFWSPVVVNYTSSAFTGTTWAVNAVEALRFGSEAINSRNLSSSGDVDMSLIDRGLFRQYKDALDPKERINIDQSSDLRSLGFKDIILQDGIEIASEYGIPGAVGYGFTIDAMRFLSMQDKIFFAEGPDWDPASRSYRFCVDVIGQLRFDSPRSFFKLATLA